MRVKHYILSVLCLFAFTTVTLAQRTVTGTVTDKDGNSLIGAALLVKGTTVGTFTDADGKYSIEVPAGKDTLIVSYVGMTTRDVPISGRSIIDVSLDASNVELDEMVVTALGMKREEKSLGYAVQKVDGDQIDKAREVNVVNNLQGKVAGVQIAGGSNNMGGSARILIRGANSFLGNNQPLFVVDGVPMDNSNFTTTNQARGVGGYDYGNAIQDLNPDDIESINVLKGPAAAALYGTRASNGVIVITTKKGSRSGKKGLGVSINSGVSWQQVNVLPAYQNKYGGGNIFDTESGFQENKVLGPNGDSVVHFFPNYGLDGSWGPKFEGQMYRPWYSFDEWASDDYRQQVPWQATPNDVRSFFNTGTVLNNNIAVSGAGDFGSFRLSYTNTDQSGVMPNSTLQRNNIGFNGSLNVTDKLSTSIGVNYVKTETVGRYGTGYDGRNVMQGFNQWWQRQLDFEKLKEYKNPDGSQRTWNRLSANDPTPHYFDNPYWTRWENFQNDSRSRYFGNLAVNYQFNDWLRMRGRVMTDFYTDRREERMAVGSVDIPRYAEGIREVSETNADINLYLDRNISDDISFNAMVGANRMYRTYNRNIAETQDGLNVPGFYNVQNSAGTPNVDDYTEERMINSIFGSASFGYREILFLDVTGRNDWSSTLPAENNSYFYPSVTTSFLFSELGGLKDNKFLTFGKLRAGWAMVGNDTDPYRLGITYTPLPNFGSNPNFTVPNTLNNADLRPERTRSWEVGAVVRIWDRINIDATYYDALSMDQIFSVSVPASSGYNFMVINAGMMQNRGIELMINMDVIKTSDFNWNLNVNYARNRNLALEIAPDRGIDEIRFTSLFGPSINVKAGQPYGTILGTDFVYDDNGNKIVDENGYYVTTGEQVPLGSAMADFTGGISNTFTYKNISLSGLIDIQQGGSFFSLTNMWGKYSGLLDETAEGNIREDGVIAEGVVGEQNADGEWVSTGESNSTAVPASTHFFFNQGYIINAADVYDASYVKLRELRLSYEFPKSMLGNWSGRLSVSVWGRNLAILHSNAPNVDPEITISSSNIQGLEGGALPGLRSFGLNVNLSF